MPTPLLERIAGGMASLSEALWVQAASPGQGDMPSATAQRSRSTTAITDVQKALLVDSGLANPRKAAVEQAPTPVDRIPDIACRVADGYKGLRSPA